MPVVAEAIVAVAAPDIDFRYETRNFGTVAVIARRASPPHVGAPAIAGRSATGGSCSLIEWYNVGMSVDPGSPVTAAAHDPRLGAHVQDHCKQRQQLIISRRSVLVHATRSANAWCGRGGWRATSPRMNLSLGSRRLSTISRVAAEMPLQDLERGGRCCSVGPWPAGLQPAYKSSTRPPPASISVWGPRFGSRS